MIEAMITYGMLFIGSSYLWGGNGPQFDCSGFIQEILKSVGNHPCPGQDLTSQQLYDQLRNLNWRSGLKRGSLCFFGPSIYHITHVSMAISDRRMLEAGGGDSHTKTVEDAIRLGAMVRIRPLRKDLQSCIIPDIL